MVQDKRDEVWDGGHAIGSRSIAAKVREAGGDAIVIQSQQEAGSTGGFGSASGTFGFLAMGGSKTITTMLVIKYLPDDPANPAPVPVNQSPPTDSITAPKP